MRHRATTFSIALLAACLAGGAAIAGDEPAQAETLAAKTARIAAAFPAPGDKAAYTFQAEMYVGDSHVGDARFVATPGVVDGKPVWKATEGWTAQVESLKQTFRIAMTLGKDLGILSSEASMAQDGLEAQHWTAERTGSGLHVSTKTGAGDPETADLKTEPLTFCPFASLALFLRQAPPETATYAFEIFDAKESRLKPATLEVKGLGTWTKSEKPVATWWALVHLYDHDAEIHMTPERELLAVYNRSSGAVLAKPGLVAAARRSAWKPATSAREAASRFTIGSSTGDVDMVAGSLHFPTLYAEAKKAGIQMSESDYRADLIARLKSGKRRVSTDVVVPIVKTAADAATETKEGDAVRVVFGGDLPTLEFLVQQFADGWYIVKMPGS